MFLMLFGNRSRFVTKAAATFGPSSRVSNMALRTAEGAMPKEESPKGGDGSPLEHFLGDNQGGIFRLAEKPEEEQAIAVSEIRRANRPGGLGSPSGGSAPTPCFASSCRSRDLTDTPSWTLASPTHTPARWTPRHLRNCSILLCPLCTRSNKTQLPHIPSTTRRSQHTVETVVRSMRVA